MLKIRLYRVGRKKDPMYSVVVGEARSRVSQFVDKVGYYNPKLKTENRSEKMVLKMDKINYWISKGAHPTEIVAKYIAMQTEK